MRNAHALYKDKIIKLSSVLKSKRINKTKITLNKKWNTHFVRERKKQNFISIKDFNQVLNIDPKQMTAEVEGACTYGNLVKQTLKLGLIPKVVPELKGITIGGAVSGLGIESSSFKYGLVHDTCTEYDVLIGTGDIVRCDKNSENVDLFKCLPNSLGSLGYITKAKLELIPAKKYVALEVNRYKNMSEYFRSLDNLVTINEIDFIDGIIYNREEYTVILGRLTDTIPSNQKTYDRFNNIFYQYVLTKQKSFYMSIYDYLWRWDSDGFWASEYHPILGKIFENKLFRNTYLRFFDHSDSLTVLKKLYDKLRKMLFQLKILKNRYEDLFQDPLLPFSKCEEFLEWYYSNINIFPLWVCPMKNNNTNGEYPLLYSKEDYLVDIGFYTRKKLQHDQDDDYYTRLFENQMVKLGVTKGLYAKTTLSESDFWSNFNKPIYEKVKLKYDPNQVFPDVYYKAIH